LVVEAEGVRPGKRRFGFGHGTLLARDTSGIQSFNRGRA